MMKKEVIEELRSKIAEDRSRRNNLKIRGIPESVQQGDLRDCTTTLFKDILPELTDLDVTIDRIHRLPKPTFPPAQVLRDVILRPRTHGQTCTMKPVRRTVFTVHVCPGISVRWLY